MTIEDLNGKKVCMLGYGREGQSVVRALEKYAPDAEVAVADQNEAISDKREASHITWKLGESYLDDLDQYDVIIKSPGIPPDQLQATSYKLLTNATQIFFDTVKERGSTIIGVTGTKGKSTTATLLADILKESGKDAHLVGNIGVPVLDFIDDAKEGTIFVQELSSYQLLDVTSSPHIAVITNIFTEHLDYHGSMEAYIEAKGNITKFQHADDLVFYDSMYKGLLSEMLQNSKAKEMPYEFKDSPVDIDKTKLMGRYKVWYIAAAVAVARHLGIDDDTIETVVTNFEGLPHRLQNIGKHHNIYWVDDAISTTPESTIFGIESILSGLGSIILGGKDRGYDFSELGKLLCISQPFLRTVILMSETDEKLEKAIRDAHATIFTDEKRNPELQIHKASTMEEAVEIAKKETPENSICLLSPASPSYNMFKNFEEKGDEFQRLAKA